jgi:copper resistance protein B
MIRPLTALSVCTAIALSLPATAYGQSMSGMNMPGMSMPAKKKPAAKKTPAKPAAKQPVGKKRTAKPAKGAAAGADKMQGMEGMDHSMMPGMAMPSASTPAAKSMPGMSQGAMPGMDMGTGAKTVPSGQAMPGMNMQGGQAMPGMDMSDGQVGHDMAAMPGKAMPGMEMTGTALPAGDAPAPAPPMDHYADRLFPGPEMARSRSLGMRESGGQNFYQVMFNLAEFQVRDGKDGYRWDGQAWFGGDINRLWLKTEGEGAFREGVESAEIQALYSRAIGPYFNLQAGVRHDFQPTPNRTYATVGFEGLAPYMFEVEGAVFISQKGDILGRLEGYYDQRITQRLILQPRVELNLAAQDVPENRIGAGLTDVELGLRLRYEIRREFAPYVGVSYQAKTGQTADFARADAKRPTSTSFVAGIHFWF